MKDTKKVFKIFTVMEYEKEQEYLRDEHKNGWKFVKVSFPGIYLFEKCTPEDVVYQLDYNEDREKNMGEYIQMFRDCGWDYICDFVGYSYFRKPVSEMNGEEEIFSDDSSKMDMIDRVFKGRMVPLLVIFSLLICPQLIRCLDGTRPLGNAVFIVYSVMFWLYVTIFVRWAIMYHKLKERRR